VPVADRIDQIGMPWPIQQENGDRAHVYTLGLGECCDVFCDRGIKLDDPSRITGSDRNFFHVDVGSMLSSTAPCTFGFASESALAPSIIASAAIFVGPSSAFHPSLEEIMNGLFVRSAPDARMGRPVGSGSNPDLQEVRLLGVPQVTHSGRANPCCLATSRDCLHGFQTRNLTSKYSGGVKRLTSTRRASH
jgi:hypothetical protein